MNKMAATTRSARGKGSLQVTGHQHEKVWDHHGSYQWTYLTDNAKSKIKYFLSTRLSGRNLDLGGGWHLLYPNSAVVDLSAVCLQRNPATEKVQFDLDTIGRGRRLPFPDSSFDSATMISVWQYLNKHDAIVEEIKRVLRPGGSLYVINQQGAGIRECMTVSGVSGMIADFFHDRGFSTLRENIPLYSVESSQFPIKGLQSVRVTMPGGKADAEGAVAESRTVDPMRFSGDFIAWEMATITGLVSKIADYPITRHSVELRERAAELGAEFREKTGSGVLAVLEHVPPHVLDMQTEGGEVNLYPHYIPMMKWKSGGPESRLLEELQSLHNLRGITSDGYGYFMGYRVDTEEGLAGMLRSGDLEGRHSGFKKDGSFDLPDMCGRFVTSVPLTDFTREMQERMRTALLEGREDFAPRFSRHEVFTIGFLVVEYKGERRIDRLIRQKEKIDSSGEPVVGRGRYDFAPYLPLLRDSIAREEREGAYERGDGLDKEYCE